MPGIAPRDKKTPVQRLPVVSGCFCKPLNVKCNGTVIGLNSVKKADNAWCSVVMPFVGYAD